MNIVILGAGNIGAHLARVLSSEEHNVILLDHNPKILEKLARDIDVATLVGEATDCRLFEDILENEPDLFLAMTGRDESNLLACSIVKNLGYPKTICRIKNIDLLTRSPIDFERLFFVDYFIAPEVLSAHDILKSILHPNDLAVANFAHGAILMRTIVIGEGWRQQGTPLKELDLPEEMIIGLIRRKKGEEEEVLFPHGETTLEKGDEVTVFGETKLMEDLHEIFSVPKKKVSSLVVVGGSDISLHLAKILQGQNILVKIIEKDPLRCKELAELLPAATILQHDGKDFPFLLSEKVKDSDAFIICTKSDASNLLLSALAKQAGCQKVITLLSDANLASVLQKLDISHSVSERVNIANRVLSILHAESVLSIASLADNQARVLEIKISIDSNLVGIPIAELSALLPRDFLIMAIENRGRVMIGKGNRILSPHDTIIVISSPKHIHELQYLF